MSRLDATAGSYVDNNQFIRPVNFIFMDFVGDPVRCNDSGMDLIISGQAEAALNGTYLGVTGDFTELSPIRVSEGGSDTVSAKLSGIKTLDDATMDVFGDVTRWKGRTAQVWRIVWNQSNVPQGAYQHYYTGYMTDVIFGGNADEQTIEVTIESYLAAFSQASNRGYLNSTYYDAGDLSGQASLSIANGGNSHIGMTPVSGGSGGFSTPPGLSIYNNML